MTSYKAVRVLTLSPVAILWLLLSLALSTVYAQTKKTGKSKNTSDYQQTQFINQYRSILKKNNPDSALKVWNSQDTLTGKLNDKTRTALLSELASGYEKNKRYNSSLEVYNKIFQYKNEIANPQELTVVTNIVKLYSLACATDSLEKYVRVLDHYTKKQKRRDLNMNVRNAELHYLKGNFDSVAYYVKQYKKTTGRTLPASLSGIANAILYKTGKYEQALREVQRSIDSARVKGDVNSRIKNELLEIEILSDLGNEKKAFDLARKLFDGYQKNNALQDEVRGRISYTYAQQLFANGKYKEAIDANTEAIQLLKNFTIEKNVDHAKAILLSAMIYTELTDYGAAELYLSEASSIFELSTGNNHTEFDELTFSKAYYHYAKDEYAESLTEAFKTLSIRKHIYGINTIKTATAYNLIGNLYEKQGNIVKSREYLDTALTIFRGFITNKDHSVYGQLFNDIGLVEQRKELIPAAIASYLESLRIYEKIYGVLHPDLSLGYMNIASLYKEMKDYKKTFYYIQKSLSSNCIKFEDTSVFANPVDNIALSDFILLRTSILKCRTLQAYADSLESIKKEAEALTYYKASIDNYFFCLRIIHRLRNSYVNEDSKIYLTEKTAFIFEEGIRICRMIYTKTKDRSFLDKAFSFSEKSKAGMLLSAIQESNAKKIAGLPDSLLTRENRLIMTINKLDKELFAELKKGKKADPVKVETYKKKLFENKQELIAYLTYIENNYNKYFKLKYDDKLISIKDVQQTLLKKEEDVFLEYFVGKDSIYIFYLTQNASSIYTSKRDSMFTRYLVGLRNSIRLTEGTTFVLCASELYKQLFEPVETLIKRKNVIIVPDVLFSNTPLQTLISNKKAEKSNVYIEKNKYRKLPYLVKQCSISYEISAAVAIQNSGKDTAVAKTKPVKEMDRLFVMAPVFDDQKNKGIVLESYPDKLPTLELDTNALQRINIPKNLVSLPGSEEEVIGLVNLFKKKKSPARAYLFNYAQKNLVTTEVLKNYGYIHFATHGELDLSNANRSGLQLLAKDNSSMDGFYSLGNVYSLELKAKLVSLSACETGLGKAVSGEGLMGFTRAFTYAGTQSIVVSLWKVNDEATTDLMNNFYRNLFSKKGRSSALQKAQVKMSKDKKFQMPLYWAAFIIYGH